MILNEGGKYLKTAEVISGDTITFKTEGEWVENTKYTYPDGNPKNDFIVKVDYKGQELSMRINQTNRNVMIAEFGRDTANWVDKTMTLTKVKALVGGKMMDILVLEPIVGELNKAQDMAKEDELDRAKRLAKEVFPDSREEKIPF